MKNILFGLGVGLFLFFGPGLVDGNFGLIGSEYFLDYLPDGLWGIIMLGLVYSLIGGSIFLVFQNLLNKSSKSGDTSKISLTLEFSLGLVLAYTLVVVVVLRAFSNFGF